MHATAWGSASVSAMSVSEIATVVAAVSAIAASASALASWRSAIASREALERTHRPFVMPSYLVRSASKRDAIVFDVTLHNEGATVALDTSWAVVLSNPLGSHPGVFSRQYLSSSPTIPQRAIRPGESVSSSLNRQPDEPMRRSDISGPRVVKGDILEAGWRIVIRYTDVAGRRWEYVEPMASEDLAPRARFVDNPDW